MFPTLTFYKKILGDIVHYIAVKNNQIYTSIELNTTPSGNCWVRHSVSHISGQGYGLAMYKLAMADIYPFGIMPSREVTSGHAVALWQKLWHDTSLSKIAITTDENYFFEADEWLDEIASVNPSLDGAAIEALEKNFSYLEAVQNNKITAHPYNHIYIAKEVNQPTIENATQAHDHLFIEAEKLFYDRYETLDL